MRASHPSFIATGRTLADLRDPLVRQWADLIGEPPSDPAPFPRPLLERQLGTLIDLLRELVGPLRREARDLWSEACGAYGRVAAARGLAAGEVVEEIQVLRELLTRNLAGTLSTMRARQAMAMMLELNRVLDRGMAAAVAGYTDALVAHLFAHAGVPAEENALDTAEVERQVGELERKVATMQARH